ncbi:XK-related protein [Trinorchestia longiramus]|nr:XK-related protein [Trinorchestia longiramus]
MPCPTVSLDCIMSLLKGDGSKQFTWMEMLFLPLMFFSYTAGYAVSIIIAVQKATIEPPTDHRLLYSSLFVLAHFAAGILNINLYGRAVRFGMREKKDHTQGIKFLDECTKAGLLRLCDSLVCDLPFLVLLLWDDLWTRADDWISYFGGDPSLPPPPPLMRWKIFRFLFILSKVAQTFSFCSVMLKRQYHHRHQDKYSHIQCAVARQGRLNFFATLLLFGGQLAFTASRTVGYSMAVTGCGIWLLAVVAVRWLANAVWHSSSVRAPKTTSLVNSLLVGSVWLLGLTNPDGEPQLGRFLLYACLACVESVVCVLIWAQAPIGPPFHDKAPWVLLTTLLLWLTLHCIRYAFCHASISHTHTSCCSASTEDFTDVLQVQFNSVENSRNIVGDSEETAKLCSESTKGIDSDPEEQAPRDTIDACVKRLSNGSGTARLSFRRESIHSSEESLEEHSIDKY